MRALLLIVLLLSSFLLKAQEITVFDEATKEPIFNVAIYNLDKSKSTLTNFDGKANISEFSTDEILFFQHMSHRRHHLTKKKILRNNAQVFLKPGENQLQEIVVSVARFEQDRQNVPQKVISLPREEIIFSNPQTSADLLENSGQVYVQKSQLGGGSPMIRGFATNRLLITVDGVRMNTAIFRGGNVQNVISIDPLAVQRTEVVLGPGSVVYGSDAIGGVMNFFTLQPSLSMNDNTLFSGNAFARYATANNEKTGHLDFSVGTQKWAFLTSASYSDFGDLRMGSHGPEEYLRNEYVVRRDGNDVMLPNDNPKVQIPTGYEQLNLLQKLRFRPNHKWDYQLGVIYSTTSNYPRYDRLYRKRDGVLRAAEWYYGPQRWLQSNFQIHKKGNGSFYDEAKLTAAYQYFEESRNDRDFGGEILYQTKEQVDAYSLNLDFEKGYGENKLFYGVEYLLNEVDSHGSETNITTNGTVPGASRYPDGANWQSMAAYGSFQWQLAEDLVLQTGARYNHILLNATFDKDFYDFPFEEAKVNTGALTGSAGLSWRQNELLNWRLNLSTAFRAPNIDDVGKIFDSAPGMVVVPNPQLEPETAYNAELGVTLNFGNVMVVDLAGYYTLLDNAMVRRDFSLNGETMVEYQGELSRVQAIQNAAEAYVYGFEAGAKINFSENLHLLSHLNITEGEEEQDDGTTAPLRHAAPLFADAHLVWKNDIFKFDLFADYNAEFSYAELAPTERDKPYLYAVDDNGNPYSPEWYTVNFTAQYRITDDLNATASLENMTDQRYRTYSSGIAAAGRNLIVALSYNF